MTPKEQPANMSMEDFLKRKQQIEDQVDYNFIQRIIQELTQSCALNVPIPASAIPPLILQAAQYFWQNDDQACQHKWFCLPNRQINKCGPNNILEARVPSHGSGAMTRSPSPLARRPDFPGAPREAH